MSTDRAVYCHAVYVGFAPKSLGFIYNKNTMKMCMTIKLNKTFDENDKKNCFKKCNQSILFHLSFCVFFFTF